MPTRNRALRDTDGRPPTSTELARRRQITDAAIEIIGESGWPACTLQAVADRIGVTKAAVVYHVGTKNELIRSAYGTVIAGFIDHVQARVEEARTPADAVVRFALAHLDYLQANRPNARVMSEALNPGNTTGVEDSPNDERRAAPLIAMIDAARAESPQRNPTPPHTLAVAIAGVIDAAAAAWLEDPNFDLDASKTLLADFIRAAV